MKSYCINSFAPDIHTGDAIGFHFSLHLGGGDKCEICAGVDEAEGGPGHFFDSRNEAKVVAAVEGQVGVVAEHCLGFLFLVHSVCRWERIENIKDGSLRPT